MWYTCVTNLRKGLCYMLFIQAHVQIPGLMPTRPEPPQPWLMDTVKAAQERFYEAHQRRSFMLVICPASNFAILLLATKENEFPRAAIEEFIRLAGWPQSTIKRLRTITYELFRQLCELDYRCYYDFPRVIELMNRE